MPSAWINAVVSMGRRNTQLELTLD
jgi:hypothetical protein